jgi:hypothetical protein
MSDTISRALREFADDLVSDPGRAIRDVILSRFANAEDDDVSDAVAELTGVTPRSKTSIGARSGSSSSCGRFWRAPNERRPHP